MRKSGEESTRSSLAPFTLSLPLRASRSRHVSSPTSPYRFFLAVAECQRKGRRGGHRRGPRHAAVVRNMYIIFHSLSFAQKAKGARARTATFLLVPVTNSWLRVTTVAAAARVTSTLKPSTKPCRPRAVPPSSSTRSAMPFSTTSASEPSAPTSNMSCESPQAFPPFHLYRLAPQTSRPVSPFLSLYSCPCGSSPWLVKQPCLSSPQACVDLDARAARAPRTSKCCLPLA